MLKVSSLLMYSVRSSLEASLFRRKDGKSRITFRSGSSFSFSRSNTLECVDFNEESDGVVVMVNNFIKMNTNTKVDEHRKKLSLIIRTPKNIKFGEKRSFDFSKKNNTF